MTPAPPGSIAAALAAAVERLTASGLPSPEVEAEALLTGITGRRRIDLHLSRTDRLPPDTLDTFRSAVERRARREPVAYILGEQFFVGRSFSVTPATLVPRPETEGLYAAVKVFLGARPETRRVLDMGTGSGCLAITLALEHPGLDVVAVDASEEALRVALLNARKLGVGGRVRFINSDLFQAFSTSDEGSFDIIVSNPPYVGTSELQSLEPELFFEPRRALDGGPDGLSVIAPLVQMAPRFLAPGGGLFIEIGHSQGSAVAALFRAAGFTNVTVAKDDNSLDRITSGTLHGPI